MGLWETYFLIDIAFILMLWVVFFPKVWKEVQKIYGVRLKKSRYNNLSYKIYYMTIVSLIIFVVFPLFFLSYIYSEDTTRNSFVTAMTRDDK